LALLSADPMKRVSQRWKRPPPSIS
jgi:hypothetical protein